MKRYWAVNRKTGRKVQVVTEAEKTAFQSTPSTDVFRFVPITPPPTAKKPAEVKKAATTKTAKPKRQVKKKTSKPDKDVSNK